MSLACNSVVKDKRPCIALVTGARSGIGKAIALKIASFSFVDAVLAVSRSIQPSDVGENGKVVPLAANVATEEGRLAVVERVRELCQTNNATTKKQLRYLIHSAGTIDPIKPALEVTPDEMRRAMTLNCEAPYFLSTALYPYMVPVDSDGEAGRILHVSSGAAHGAPPVGWSVYGITKAAFFQSYKVLEREFRHLGGKVVVGSFKPGVVDTSMQANIRDAPKEAMPVVGNFQGMKDRMAETAPSVVSGARPPPKGALDSPENVAYFAEWLLLGTSDEEFCNKDDTNEYDIRNSALYEKWIPPENLPKE